MTCRYNEMGYQIIPSHRGREGWNAFCKELEQGGRLYTKRDTREELMNIHDMMSTPALEGRSIPLEANQDMYKGLLILDRPDGEKIQAQVEERHGSIDNIFAEGDVDKLNEVVESYVFFCRQNTQIKLDRKFSGKLRSYGKRKIDNGEWGAVYASNSFRFGYNTGFRSHPDAHYTLTRGLDEVYNAMCDRYDKISREVKDGSLDEILLCEAFLNLVGTAVLHPFWDANARAFAGHIGLTLYRHGIKLSNYETVKKMSTDLSILHIMFTNLFLEKKGFIVSGDLQHYRLRFDYKFRQEYMTRLKTSIDDLIDHGIDQSEYLLYYKIAVSTIKGHIYPDNSPTMSRTESM